VQNYRVPKFIKGVGEGVGDVGTKGVLDASDAAVYSSRVADGSQYRSMRRGDEADGGVGRVEVQREYGECLGLRYHEM